MDIKTMFTHDTSPPWIPDAISSHKVRVVFRRVGELWGAVSLQIRGHKTLRIKTESTVQYILPKMISNYHSDRFTTRVTSHIF
jgi:hypothetical protein